MTSSITEVKNDNTTKKLTKRMRPNKNTYVITAKYTLVDEYYSSTNKLKRTFDDENTTDSNKLYSETLKKENLSYPIMHSKKLRPLRTCKSKKCRRFLTKTFFSLG